MSNPVSIPGLAVPDGIHAQIITVGPDMAEQWLSRNSRNRNVSQSSVNRYATDMTEGRWRFNPQPIIFDAAGRLIDGQHRLHAQVKAEASVKWLVVAGVPADVQDVIDIGSVRTVGNQLQLAGYANGTRMGAVAAIALAYEGDTISPSKPAIREYAETYADEINAALSQTIKIALQFKTSCASLAYAAIILNRIDADASAEFFELMTNGAGLPKGSPILVCRAALLKALQSRAVGSTGMGTRQRIAFVNYVFRVWNYWRQGKTVKTVYMPKGKVTPR